MVVSKAKSEASNWLALQKSKDKVFQKKASIHHQKVQKQKGKKKEYNKGVVFVSNIPHGFYEDEMREYFSQFGGVERLRLARSKRTGESCGFGYVEFQHKEVANIVAEHMDGYLTFGKIMKCQYIPPENVSGKIFAYKHVRPYNCPKIVSRKNAIVQLNRFRSEWKVDKRLKRLTQTYRKKQKMLESFGISLNLGLPEVETQDDEENHTESMEESLNTETSNIDENQESEVAEIKESDEDQRSEGAEVKKNQALKVKEGVSSKPKKMKKIAGTGAKSLSENITQGESLDDDIHHSSQNLGKMVIEVDESDGEIQFKTPPNAVKKFVKIVPSSEEVKNSVSIKTIPAAAKKKSVKKKGTTRGLSETALLEELKTATAVGMKSDESTSLENMSSNPSVTRNKKVPKSKKNKFAVKDILESKENLLQSPTLVDLADRDTSIQDSTPSSTTNDLLLSKTTPVKRKQTNVQTSGKKIPKKRKVEPCPAITGAQDDSAAKLSCAKGTQEETKTLSNGMDTSSCEEVMTIISQLPSVLQTPEETQFPVTPKRSKTPKKSKTIKKTVTPLVSDTQTPIKEKEADIPKTPVSLSLPPDTAILENAIIPESKIEMASGMNTIEDVEMIKTGLQSSPDVGSPKQTSEQEHLPPSSKKTKTPKNKTKKIVSGKRTGSPNSFQTPKKVVATKTVLSDSVPLKEAESENGTVSQKTKIESSPGTITYRNVGVMTDNSYSSPVVENSSQTDQVQFTPTTKKIKTPKSPATKITKTPESSVTKKIKTSKTPTNKITETPKSTTTKITKTPKSTATKITGTPKSKTKKTLPLKRKDSLDCTSEEVEKVKKIVTPKTVDSQSIPTKNIELENTVALGKSDTKTSSGTNIGEELEMQVSPAVENPMQQSEKVSLPLSSKKIQTPKNKTKKIDSQKTTGCLDNTQTPKKVKKGERVFSLETGDCTSILPNAAELESVEVLEKNEIKTSCLEENPTQSSEQVQLSLSGKKTENLKKTPKRRDTKTPRKVKALKNVGTPKTQECNGLQTKVVESENVVVSSESEMKIVTLTRTAEIGEMISNTSLLSPGVELPKQTRTPKNKRPKKAISPKITGGSDLTQTPKNKKTDGKELITKTPNLKSSSKKSKLGNHQLIIKEESISGSIKKVLSLTPAHLKKTPKQKIKSKVPKSA